MAWIHLTAYLGSLNVTRSTKSCFTATRTLVQLTRRFTAVMLSLLHYNWLCCVSVCCHSSALKAKQSVRQRKQSASCRNSLHGDFYGPDAKTQDKISKVELVVPSTLSPLWCCKVAQVQRILTKRRESKEEPDSVTTQDTQDTTIRRDYMY